MLFEDVEDILLKLIPSSEEYYDFLSIEDMVFYILDYGLIEHISLFECLLGSFFEVISFKLFLKDHIQRRICYLNWA